MTTRRYKPSSTSYPPLPQCTSSSNTSASTSASASTSTSTSTAVIDARKHVLDLHGYTQPAAITELTRFLDLLRHQHKHQHQNRHSSSTTSSYVPVTIVTGSGKHSPHGPVLREAVQRTLTKRQMKYSLNQGRGAFTVDALSGVDLYYSDVHRDNPNRYDSKVLLVGNNSDTNRDVKIVNRPVNSLKDGNDWRELKSSSSSSHESNASSNDDDDDDDNNDEREDGPIISTSDPLPHEVALEDSILLQTKQQSHASHRQHLQTTSKLQSQFQSATQESLALHSQYTDQENKALQDMEELLRQSEEEEKERVALEEKERILTDAVLKMSQQKQEDMERERRERIKQQEEEEQRQLEEILRISELEAQIVDMDHKLTIENNNGDDNEEDEDEDEMLRRALEQSMHETGPTIINDEHGDGEDDAHFELQLKLAMEQSLGIASTSASVSVSASVSASHNHYDDDDSVECID